MNLQQRIELLEKLGKYILSDSVNWEQVKERAYQITNGSFLNSFPLH